MNRSGEPPEESASGFLQDTVRSEPDPGPDRDPSPRPDRRRRAEPTSKSAGCLPMAVLAIVVLALVFVGGRYAWNRVGSAFSGPEDFSGTGSGSVVFEVEPGDTAAAIGRKLKSEGVVKSVDAFNEAARADQRSRSIQVGFYQLNKQMEAAEALKVLVDPANLVQGKVTVPEGARIAQIAKAIPANSDLTPAQVNDALAHPERLGLPPEANGKLEGYLFPATYTIPPGVSATDLLSQMVAKTVSVQDELDLSAQAKAVNLTPAQVLTVASILEYEGSRDEDYPKIARAIYNRLKIDMPLQSDATVAYAGNIKGTVWTTAEQRANPSAYNTYAHPGLPPGPIGSPGKKTIEAALNPADGPWLYWLVVNLRTGETRFNTTLAEHLKDKQVLDEYCRGSEAC